ncbi:hypothetical protein DWF00_05980 [Bosea caraganae]|uniref:DUF995 domain-containing protein n=1 Tax=Bosea caraganae TaxID=2763117 RepID=A0A370L397_9HYPH|nr:hypothetical protein [Bosea caraganae]RDJ22912.1 hypothetical protein DWE98_17225 [Bosea caraganae]RDJ28692.1 hypothetical protein DWF00_05980 [Bosea caraganae]
MRTGWVIAFVVAMLLHGLAAPVQAEDRMSGEDIRRTFEGHTVSGRFKDGKFFSEYHDANGQAVGHNGNVPNTDACWTIKDDQICYYYGAQEQQRVHCYRVQPIGKLLHLHHTVSSSYDAFVTAEPGNPRHLSDNGKPWYCGGLISQAPEQGVPQSRRLAAR